MKQKNKKKLYLTLVLEFRAEQLEQLKEEIKEEIKEKTIKEQAEEFKLLGNTAYANSEYPSFSLFLLVSLISK